MLGYLTKVDEWMIVWETTEQWASVTGALELLKK